jgi:hypothetical protein
MPGKRKEVEGERPFSVSDIGLNEPWFNDTMADFWNLGEPSRLQRWFVSAGTRDNAEKVAALMVQKFAERLAILLEGTPGLE